MKLTSRDKRGLECLVGEENLHGTSEKAKIRKHKCVTLRRECRFAWGVKSLHKSCVTAGCEIWECYVFVMHAEFI